MKKSRNVKSCHKVGYHTKQAARDALKRFGRERGSVRSYKCPHCKPRPPHKGVWHLTSESR